MSVATVGKSNVYIRKLVGTQLSRFHPPPTTAQIGVGYLQTNVEMPARLCTDDFQSIVVKFSRNTVYEGAGT